MPSVSKGNKSIWAIRELYDVEQSFEMAIHAFQVIQRHKKISFIENNLEILQRKIADEKALSEHTFRILEQCWKSILRKLLPDYPNILEAIASLYTNNESELFSIATFRQIQ